jgi:hypothetical protein
MTAFDHFRSFRSKSDAMTANDPLADIGRTAIPPSREKALVRDEVIAEVGIDDERRVFVRPASGDFEYVYRAAMEVYWDRTLRRLSHPRRPRTWTAVQWFEQIIAAVADEYGVKLKLTSDTVWTGVHLDIQSGIETVARTNGG